jgi:uncharacterized membrane protein YidH (DUF202 family)
MTGAWDPGLANERTALAWRRSALSLATVAGFLLHAALDGAAWPLGLAGAVALALAAAWTERHGRRVYRVRATDGEAYLQRSSRALGALSCITVAAAAMTLAQLAVAT